MTEDTLHKNNDSKPKRSAYLTAVLVFLYLLSIITIISVISLLIKLPTIDQSAILTGSTAIGLEIISLICLYGLWLWKKWGYYGFMILLTVNLFLGIYNGKTLAIGFDIVVIATLYILMKDKMNYLE